MTAASIPFLKMHGAGNDFIVVDRLDGRSLPDGWEEEIPAMCHRRRGIGADGVIVLEPGDGADFRMRYHNADGSTGTLCGNGGRCAAAYVMELTGRPQVAFLSNGRPYSASRVPSGIRLSMEEPGPPRMDLRIELPDGTVRGHFIDTGSPHLVIAQDSAPPDPRAVITLGRQIRLHPEFAPSGTNVDFVTVTGNDRIGIRTYERGVEDETWACGTGAVAAAMIRSILDGGEGERRIEVTPLSGETLTVGFSRTGSRFTGVFLEGPSARSFEGNWTPGR